MVAILLYIYQGNTYCQMKNLKEKISNIPLGLKSSIVFTLSTLFTRGLAIITMPIFTRIMTTEEIGLVNLYNSWYSMISVISTLSLTSGGFQILLKEYRGRRKEYMSSVSTLTSLVAILLAIIYFSFQNFWNNITGLPTELMILMLIGFLVAPARDFWLYQQRYEYRYKLAGIISFAQAIFATGLSILIVLQLRDSNYVAEGRLFANYAVIYGVAFIFWLILFIQGKTFYNREFWMKSLSLSIPLIGYSIAVQILNVSDRIMIGNMIGNSEVGIYGTLYSVSSICTLFWGALNSSFIPYLYENIGKSGNKIKQISSLMLSAYSLISILITYLAPEIVWILATEEYYEAIYIMPPIAAGVYLMAVTNMYSNIAVFYKKTLYVMLPALIAAILNIGLNYVFIPRYGYMAAAYTTLLAYIVLATMQALFSLILQKKQGSLQIYNNVRILLISICTIVLDIIALLLYQSPIARYCAVGGGFVIGIILGIMFIKWKKSLR